MPALKLFFTGILTASLLAGCAGNSSLWGSLPTPTPAGASATDDPGPAPSPARTPLMVLPMPGSPTPGGLVVLGQTPVSAQASPTLPPINTGGPMVGYNAQGGDTLEIVAKRFGVKVEEIGSDTNLPGPGILLEPGTLLLVPNRLPDELSPREETIPDSEIPYSPSNLDFDTLNYVRQQNGYLASYSGYMMSYAAEMTGAQAVQQFALDNSLNPRILLAIIEYESHWVRGQPTNLAQQDYPLGYLGDHSFFYTGLLRQLMWATAELSEGYYRWRSGDLTELTFTDGATLRLDPRLNAGTAAIQYFFSLNRNRASWDQAVADTGFPATYRQMFGDPWQRAKSAEPNIRPGLAQPALTLPFERGKVWTFIGGPHSAWQEMQRPVVLEGGALAALDFAPPVDYTGCHRSNDWVISPADGKVVRVDKGVVMLDLDGDGLEQTGWDILFLHIATLGRAPLGAVLKAGDHIGHPSCEGGKPDGTHVHIARKYNGEWMLAGGPLPFEMDGWVVQAGDAPYRGSLTRAEKSIEAIPGIATSEDIIIRDK